MSVTLSKSDISLTTPRTGTSMHAHMQSLFHTHIVFVSSVLPPLCSLVHKHVSNGIHNRQRSKQCIESIPASMAEAIKFVVGYSMSDRCQLKHGHAWSSALCWTPVIKTTTHVGLVTATVGVAQWFFCPSGLFCIAVGTSWPVFCTTLLSPARWIFYEPGNVGFCVEDWNINMAVAPRAPLSILIQKLS